MKENFDCTQFITFNLLDGIDIEIYLREFENIGFKILPFEKIRNVKKMYMKDYFQEIVFELEYDNFLGFFEDWESISDIPQEILCFARVIEKMVTIPSIRDLKVILTGFAEEGLSSDELIKVKNVEIIKGLFYMSNYNYDVWSDNLILDIS